VTRAVITRAAEIVSEDVVLPVVKMLLSVFERFTEPAKTVVMLAQAEARRSGQREIGSEHLLIGMVQEGTGIASTALHNVGVTAERLREQSPAGRGPGDTRAEGQLPFTRHAKLVLELALRESLRLDQGSVGTEHLLLGMTDLREGSAIRLLGRLGVGPDTVRIAVGELMDTPVGQPAIHREYERVRLRGDVADWVQVAPSENLRRVLSIVAGRVGDSGRSELEPVDLLLAFTLVPGPAHAAGLRLSLDEEGAANERDRAWAPTGSDTPDKWAGIGHSVATRRLLMIAGGGALIRGSSIRREQALAPPNVA
jgi:hypothetical protein